MSMTIRGSKDDLTYLHVISIQFVFGLFVRSGLFRALMGLLCFPIKDLFMPTVHSKAHNDASYGAHYARYAGWPFLWIVRFLRTYWEYDFGVWDPRDERAFLSKDDPERLNSLWCFNYHCLFLYFIMLATDIIEDKILSY